MSLITSIKYYESNPQNKTIMYLHGWGCNLTYLECLKLNDKKYNYLLVDLPGFGENKALEKPLLFDDYLSECQKLIDKYNVFYLVGHSFGGKISAYLLLQNPQIKGATLLSPSILKKKRNISYYLKVYIYKFLKYWLKLSKIADKMGSDDYKRCNKIMKHTMSNVINYSKVDELKHIKQPVIIFAGKQDNITSLKLERETAELFTDSFLFLIKGDHFAYIKNALFIKRVIKGQASYETD